MGFERHGTSACAILVLFVSSDATASTPDYTTTAERMTQEVLADPVAAAKKYQDKLVELTGTTITPVKPNPTAPKGMLTLAGAPQSYSTDRTNVEGIPAAADQAQAAEIPAGRAVRLVGKVTSCNTRSVVLSSCSVSDQGPGPEPAPERDAAEVAAALAKDEAAARKKFAAPEMGPFLLIVKGEVAEIARSGKTATLRLAGPDGAVIEGTVKADDVSLVKKGGKARLAGLYQGYEPKTKTLKLEFATGMHTY
jgi:hypothetical protein